MSESGGLAGVVVGRHGTAAPGSAPLFLQETRGLLARWKRWLGGALCQRAGAVGGRLPPVSQQMPQLKLCVFLCCISAPGFASPEGALRPEPSVTPRTLRGPGSWALPRREAPGRWASLAPPVYVFHSLSWLLALTLGPSPSRKRRGACFFALLRFLPSLPLASPASTGSPGVVFPWGEQSHAGTASRFMLAGCGLCPDASGGSGAKPGLPTPGGPLSLFDSCPGQGATPAPRCRGSRPWHTPCLPPEGGGEIGPPNACTLACVFPLPAGASRFTPDCYLMFPPDPDTPSRVLEAELLRAFGHLPASGEGTSFTLFMKVVFYFNHWFLFLQSPLQD